MIPGLALALIVSHCPLCPLPLCHPNIEHPSGPYGIPCATNANMAASTFDMAVWNEREEQQPRITSQPAWPCCFLSLVGCTANCCPTYQPRFHPRPSAYPMRIRDSP